MTSERLGPFRSARAVDRVCNGLYRHGPTAVVQGGSFLAAAGVYALLAGPLARTRLLRYRGPTRCGVCGYTLTGLREARCPECGKGL